MAIPKEAKMGMGRRQAMFCVGLDLQFPKFKGKKKDPSPHFPKLLCASLTLPPLSLSNSVFFVPTLAPCNHDKKPKF